MIFLGLRKVYMNIEKLRRLNAYKAKQEDYLSNLPVSVPSAGIEPARFPTSV